MTQTLTPPTEKTLQDKTILSTIEAELGEQFPWAVKVKGGGQGPSRMWWKDRLQTYLREGRKRTGEWDGDVSARRGTGIARIA